ncbi:MAG: YCII-related protein [uncultured bacterium]|nr:MAG: YCII-related protein [uncultured bacterium]
MRVALICIDKPGHLQTRLDNRAAHLAHIEASGVVEMAGPFLNDGQMTGSLVVLNVDTLEQAQAWAAADPYAKAGLFDSVTITEWKKVVG